MKSLSSIFAVLLMGVAFMVSSHLVNAAAIEPPAANPGLPASKTEWDKLVRVAKQEGKVMIVAGPIGDARTALMNAFQQEYGIPLDIVIGRGEELLAKMETERRSGVYVVDAIMHGMTTYFNSRLLQEVTVPMTPLLALPEVLDLSRWRGGKLPYADEEGHLASLVMGPLPPLLINSHLVKTGEINSHQDLLNPKWRGKLVINDPSVGGAGTEWFTFVVKKIMGQEKGITFMKQLALQEPVIMRDQRLLTEWVARGKYAIAVAPDRATAAVMIRAGAPLKYPDLKEPRPISTGAGNLAVMDRRPHPNATKLFANWILSKDGSAVYSKAHGVPSPRLDVSTEGIDPAFIPKPDETILGKDYQLSKGKMRKLAAEVFRNLIK